MSYTTLDLTIENHIAHLRLERPSEYNSMSRAFWREFPEALCAIESANDVRVVVLSSSGKHFCAGMDLEVFQQPDPRLFSGEPGRRGEFIRRLVLELQACFSRLETLRMPVLSVIQGGCIGGGVDLICATDIRYCTREAFFTVKETHLGMVADLGTLQRLPRLVPDGLAREWIYTGRKVNAEEAMLTGLVNQVFDDVNSMEKEVLQVAREIAANSPLALTGCKNVLNYSRDHSVEDGLQYTATWQAGMFQSADLMESFIASGQHRPPDYGALSSVEPVMTKPPTNK